MPGYMLMVNGHRLDIQLHTTFTAAEVVKYDGEEKSNKSSMLGTTHDFEVTEDGQVVKYEIETFLSWTGAGCRVRRNGELIFEPT